MDDFVQGFEDRLQEIETYLDLLAALEKQVQAGPPRIGGNGPTITVQQQRILYSSVYLQLYNLVESTITRCVDAVATAVVEDGTWFPNDLSDELRREWVRHVARTHTELTFANRLESALQLCNHLVQALPITVFRIDKGGGSWDDFAIEDISQRIGLAVQLSAKVKSNVKQPFRNEQGPLKFIKSLRNDLAHGSLSFAECGENITVQELRDLKDFTALYLREVVQSFKAAIDAQAFLLPGRRPNSVGSSS